MNDDKKETSFKSRVLKSFVWLGTGTFAGQLISWVATIVVIRLLSTSDYGLMAMANTFIAFFIVMSDLGLSAAIIQSDQIEENEIRQLLGFIIVTGIICIALSYFVAPAIALFYNENRLIPIIRLLSLNFIIIAMYIVPQSLFIREMDFKTKAKVDISAQTVASILVLYLALNGFGVWALVLGTIAIHSIKMIGFNLARSNLIIPIFRYKGIENLIKYGVIISGDRLFYYLYTQVDRIIIGRFLGDQLLGIYAVASNLASLPMEKVMPLITQISFAAYSRIQGELERIRINILKSTRITAFFCFPIFLGLAGIAPGVLPLILSPKWESVVIPFQLLCLIMPLKALSVILPPAVQAIGKPKVNLINMIISFISIAFALLIGIKAGILGVCIAWIVAYSFVFLIISIRCLRVLDLPFMDYVAEFKYPCCVSVLMLISILLIEKVIMGMFQPIPHLIIIVSFGIAFYSCYVVIFRREDIMRLKSIMKR